MEEEDCLIHSKILSLRNLHRYVDRLTFIINDIKLKQIKHTTIQNKHKQYTILL